MFLRADAFDVKHAAARIASFFQAKLELFGPEKLSKEIGINDLNQDDIECLESGYCQVLPGRDRAGRVILVLLPQIRSAKSVENKVRDFVLVSFLISLQLTALSCFYNTSFEQSLYL